MTKPALLTAIVILALLFLLRWAQTVRTGVHGAWSWPSPVQSLIGVGVNFLDTLGIGSLATTTTAFKALRLVPDERLPGTMIVGLTMPVVAQALIFITVVEIDTTMLALMIATALAGGWIGAGVVSRLPRRPIQGGMGVALLVAALFMVLSQLGLMPSGGTGLGLSGARLLLALIVNFVLGALIMLGIGNYGPTFVLLSVLGMDPRAAFPIMMGSGAFAALLGGLRFLKAGSFELRPAIGLTLGGIPAVLVAGLLVKSLPLDIMRWLVVVVVLYAAVVMLKAAGVGARGAIVTALLAAITMITPSLSNAQRPQLTGGVAPSAIGTAARQPAPVGGLRTTPLAPRNASSVLSPSGTSRIDGTARLSQGNGRFSPYVWLPIADARVQPYGVAVTREGEHAAPAAPAWIPSYQPPRWVIDSAMPTAPLWRDLIVTDVLCNVAGACMERQQRVRARWMARCDCYVFGDAWNRIWRVADRARNER